VLLPRVERTKKPPVWVIFANFSGECRLDEVRFYPVCVQPGPARKRCVWPRYAYDFDLSASAASQFATIPPASEQRVGDQAEPGQKRDEAGCLEEEVGIVSHAQMLEH
jgi:hypothetical protein